ncbi:biotin synthase BioB [Candidatus Poribacteria bacterium]|mgnify:FL=1|nr:biotin synthase BioB [Candidatus Poribacteria bacterium]
MEKEFYCELTLQSMQGELLSDELCMQILNASSGTELLPLLDAAYQVRKKYFGNEVQLHMINNAQNGYCPEDCHYCSQANSSDADIEKYTLKSDKEIIDEAERAYKAGAFRYCMVFAGRGPSKKRVEHLAQLVRDIKALFPIQVCISAGIIDKEDAQVLKHAGLDRLNHNINTSETNYPNICTTHTYADRINTLQVAEQVGIELCSGIIVGMGERTEDLIELAKTFRELGVSSIPINYLIPFEGNVLSQTPELDPEYCLRILALYRLVNPDADIRVAAGRELHFRSMEVMALYPANSLFIDGYLNSKGGNRERVIRMIEDAGFVVKTDKDMKDLLPAEGNRQLRVIDNHENAIKDINDLRPRL